MGLGNALINNIIKAKARTVNFQDLSEIIFQLIY